MKDCCAKQGSGVWFTSAAENSDTDNMIKICVRDEILLVLSNVNLDRLKNDDPIAFEARDVGIAKGSVSLTYSENGRPKVMPLTPSPIYHFGIRAQDAQHLELAIGNTLRFEFGPPEGFRRLRIVFGGTEEQLNDVAQWIMSEQPANGASTSSAH